MRKVLYLLPLVIFFFACHKEEILTPSNADETTLIEYPDMSKPLVSQYKNDYNVSIVYRFNDVTDFRFAFMDRVSVTNWNKVNIQKVDENAPDYALQMLDSLVLKYFNDEIVFQGQTFTSDFRKTYFPKHIFVADSISGSYSAIGQKLGELNLYETEKYYSFLWNGYEPMFAFNKAVLSVASASGILKYRNSMLYCFLSELFMQKGIHNQFPAAMYEPVVSYYGTSINDLAESEGVARNYSGPGNRYVHYDPVWYNAKGFALTNRSPFSISTYSNTTSYKATLDSTATLTFPDKDRDFRNLLHVMICENSVSNIQTYLFDEVFKARMRIFIEEMYKRGIDVFLVNPAMKQYF